MLRIFDAAPDARERTRLAEHNFPLTALASSRKETVQPLAEMFQHPFLLPEHSLFRSAVDLAVDRLFSLISTML
ncbi:MAG: hypothetical protein PVG14_09240 [Anaerolineales bacterium]|jgi:hypothetical protein